MCWQRLHRITATVLLFTGLLSPGLAQQYIFEQFTEKDGLASSQVFDAAQDMEGNLWFATSKGICFFNGIDFKCFGKNDGIPGEILGIYLDYSRNLWCYSSEGRIYRFEHGKFVPVTLSAKSTNVLGNRIVNSIYAARSNAIWLSTVVSGGLYKITEGKMEQVEIGNKHSFYIKEIEINGFVWGSNKIDEENNKLRILTLDNPFTISLSQKGGHSKSSFTRLRDDTYLFAKDYELVNFKYAAVVSRAFVEKNVEAILQDSEGKIWVALYMGGVLCYPDGNISANPVSYLGNKTVTSILEDNSGNIWLTTFNNGIYFLPARPGIAYTAPQVYSKTNSDEVEEMSVPVATHSQPEITSALNFRVITTDTGRYDTIPPAIYISGLKILGKDTALQEHYDLPYNMNYLKINYVGFAYNNPEILQYRYRMEGVDDDWVHTGSTFAQYPTLPPGKYKFTVSAMNKNGYWSESPASVTFIINPPFWNTWWFIAGAVLSGFLIVGMFLFFRIRQVKKKEREKTEINKRIADIELLALRTQMNPHFIFNTMSSIQHYITNSNTEAALNYLSKFAKLMRSIIENSRAPAIPVKAELNALKLYLELETLRFKNKFDYKIDVDGSIDVHYDEIPPMLIQPYAENAILHGFMHKEEKGFLRIGLKKLNGIITCEVVDDGIGRKKSQEINRAKNKTHKSRGMSITQERLEILNSLNDSKLSVNIIDLENEQRKATGTKVEIFIPVDKSD